MILMLDSPISLSSRCGLKPQQFVLLTLWSNILDPAEADNPLKLDDVEYSMLRTQRYERECVCGDGVEQKVIYDTKF